MVCDILMSRIRKGLIVDTSKPAYAAQVRINSPKGLPRSVSKLQQLVW
jgi:hypothetical protein